MRDRSLPPPAPLPEGPFELIYADPPWQLGHPDSPHAPENHYATMDLDSIKAVEVPVAEDAVLFLWAVSSLLPEAIDVMGAWGFSCKTTLCWVKPSIGPGVWARNRHELLLIGRRGTYPPPEPEDRADSVLEAPRSRHSEKPGTMYELLERMYPHASKLELFSREAPAWLGRLGQRGRAVSERLLTAAEVAELLAVPISWVREATRGGRVPHVCLGRYRRYELGAIEAWLEEQRGGPAPARQRLDLSAETSLEP